MPGLENRCRDRPTDDWIEPFALRRRRAAPRRALLSGCQALFSPAQHKSIQLVREFVQVGNSGSACCGTTFKLSKSHTHPSIESIRRRNVEELVKKTAVVQAFRPAVTGRPKGLHYI
jgi:hypothetical protein